MERITLSNGVRLVMQPISTLRSVSLGIWVNTGSVRELPAEAGASHFIEHMVFKGTKRRTAKQIAAEMDAIGGAINAFTAKECTCFYARVLDEDLPVAVDVLSDILLNSCFDSKEIEREKRVVMEEILMTEDSPEDLCSEMGHKLFFGDDPIALPIMGTIETVSSFTRESLLAYMQKHYQPKNIVIACAGHFVREELIALLEQHFSLPAAEACNPPLVHAFPGGQRLACVEKDIEQVHITLMLPGCGRDDKRRHGLAVLSSILGGSMSSRLFQSIREQRGLSYSLYAYPVNYSTSGALALYAGTGEKQAEEVLSLMLKELRDIRDNGITEDELQRCKQQLKGSFLLGMETADAIMSAIAKAELLLNVEYCEERALQNITRVTMQDVQEAIRYCLDEEHLVACFVGRTQSHEAAFKRILGFEEAGERYGQNECAE